MDLIDPKDGGEDRIVKDATLTDYVALNKNKTLAKEKFQLPRHDPKPHDLTCQWCGENRRVVHTGISKPHAPTRQTFRCVNCDVPGSATIEV